MAPVLLVASCTPEPAVVQPPTVAVPVVSVTSEPEASSTPSSDGAAAAGPSTSGMSAFTVPATGAGKNGWAEYVDSPAYDSSNVAGVAPGRDSPEAAVVHYLASRVRGDSRYQEVMASACSSKCARGLAKHAEWTFLGFRLVARKDAGDGELWVKAWFKIRANEREDSGTDEFTLTRASDGWRISEVPR